MYFCVESPFSTILHALCNEAVEDYISQSEIANSLTPIFHQELASDDGRVGIVGIVEEFEQIAAVLILLILYMLSGLVNANGIRFSALQTSFLLVVCSKPRVV